MSGRRETTTVTTRYLAALGVSLGCHATVLLALMLLPFPQPSLVERPIVVAVYGDAGVAGGGGAGEDAAAGDGASQVGAVRGDEAALPAQAAPVAASPEHGTADASADATRPFAAVSRPPPQRSRPRHAATAASRALDVPAADAARVGTTASARADDDASGQRSDAMASSRGVDDRAASSARRGDGADGDGGARAAGMGGHGHGAGSMGAGIGGDLRASCAMCPIPEYPARARRQGWQGTVDVELYVGRDGAVAHASIGRSSGFALLDAAAVTVARRSRFRVVEGAELHGQLRYRFILDEAHDRPL